MAAVSAVHEQVDERAQEQQRVGQVAPEVHRMLGNQIEAGDGEKGEQASPAAERRKRPSPPDDE
jgi:hypothetical protein